MIPGVVAQASPGESSGEGAGTTEEDYLYVEEAVGALECVQMNTIEFHGWGSRIDPLENPDRLVFDLDPDEGRRAAQGPLRWRQRCRRPQRQQAEQRCWA